MSSCVLIQTVLLSERDSFVNECVSVWMSGCLLPFEYNECYGYGVNHLSLLCSSVYGYCAAYGEMSGSYF